MLRPGRQVADRVHREVLEALPTAQRGEFVDALTSLTTGLLATPVESARPVRRPRLQG